MCVHACSVHVCVPVSVRLHILVPNYIHVYVYEAKSGESIGNEMSWKVHNYCLLIHLSPSVTQGVKK